MARIICEMLPKIQTMEKFGFHKSIIHSQIILFGGFCHCLSAFDRGLVEASPSDFIAGRDRAAVLFWFFGDFRCGVLLFMAILVIYKYKKIGKNSC